MAARILVADDDAGIVRLVRAYLEQSGFIVLTAADGETALHAIRRERPDLVVLDVMMPLLDGFDVLRKVRADAALAGTPVLMLTARVDDADKLAGLSLGADDYLAKPFNPHEVVARARAILRRAGGTLQPSPIIQIRGLTMNLEARAVSLNGVRLDLTPTEYDILRAFMQHPNHTYSRGELIEVALGYEYDGFDRTIDSHIKNLRRKVEPNPSQPEFIETVFGVGYRLRE